MGTLTLSTKSDSRRTPRWCSRGSTANIRQARGGRTYFRKRTTSFGSGKKVGRGSKIGSIWFIKFLWCKMRDVGAVKGGWEAAFTASEFGLAAETGHG